MSSFDIFGNPTEQNYVSAENKTVTNFEFDTESNIRQEVSEENSIKNFYGYYIFLFGIVTLLVFQCFNLQVKHNTDNKLLSDKNSIIYTNIQPERGLITDINGNVLARNDRQVALAINPQTLPTKKTERDAVYNVLRSKAAIKDDTIQYIEKNRLTTAETFIIRQNLSKEDSLLYKEWFNDLPGVVVEEVPIRNYSTLTSIGQILGYVGVANEKDIADGFSLNQIIGKGGIEKQYNTELSGKIGKTKTEVNAYGEVVRTISSTESTKEKTGATGKLNIDQKLQEIVATALKNELERRTKRLGEMKQFGATAVAIDPNTGAIKALVSLPDYDNNLFAKGITEDQYKSLLDNPANPLLNKAIQGQYPPGSTVKPLIAGAALQEGVIKENTEMVTPEAITIGEFRFPDWKYHGQTNTRKAIAESNDVFFYAVGGGWAEKNFTGLGMERMNKYLSFFSLGNKTGIDINGEQAGLLPNDAWKRSEIKEPWYIDDTYHSSIGQDYTLATPLQMAVGTAAIANGGTTWEPKLVYSTIDPTTNVETVIQPKVLFKDFITQKNIQTVREGMRQTVESGSARPLNTLKVTSAGKTGTAEFGNSGQMHAWYTGFAPYENPQLAFSILIEGGGDSYQSSVPVAEEILRNYFNDPLAPGQKLNSEPNLANSEFSGEH